MQIMQTGGCPPAPTPSQPPATVYYNSNNQVTFVNQAAPSSMSMPGGFGYDSAGNVTQDNQNQYLYDAEGRICAVSNTPLPGMTTLTGYIYSASGSRVSKGTIATMSCDPAIAGFTPTNDFILGPGGEQETEVGWDANNTLAWQHTNVFAGSRLVATYDNDGLHFHVTDPLGTRRVQTDYAGVVEQTCQSLPFGDALACTNSSQYPTEHHFTGKERDAESGNDYFGARYYASGMGRWMSPDSLIMSPEIGNPQNLNKYSYTFNRPLSLVDPDGHWPTWYHTEVDRNFFGNQLHMSMHDQYVIVGQSASQDGFLNGGQSPSNSVWHGMRNGFDLWSDPVEAVAEARNYITSELNTAIALEIMLEKWGPGGFGQNITSDDPLKHFANALHATQDLDSPEHAGKPWWGDPFTGIAHFIDETKSSTSSRASDEEARAETIYDTQVLWARYQYGLNVAREKEREKGCERNATTCEWRFSQNGAMQ